MAYLSPTGALGGAELCLIDLLSSIRATRPDWEPIVLLGGDGPLRQEVESLGIRCDVLPLPANLARLGDAGFVDHGRLAKLVALGLGGMRAFLGTSRYGRDLARWLRSEAPNLVHTNGMKMHALASWTAPRRLRLVWQLHDYLGPRPAMARILRMSVREGLSAVAVSRSVAEDAARTLGPKVPVHTIYNRIDLARFHPGPGDGARLDEAAGLPEAEPGTLRVGLVATFALWKGHRLFLEAVARLPREIPTRFYIVGGPIYQSAGSQVSFEELKALAHQLGVADRVGLTGHLVDPAAAIRSLDVVVHASTRPEPFGRVIVEGMACGRAVVAIRDGGAAELFDDDRTALGCPPNDAEALAAAIGRLLSEPETRERLGKAGREAAAARFDRTRLADDWSAIYGCMDRAPDASSIDSTPRRGSTP